MNKNEYVPQQNVVICSSGYMREKRVACLLLCTCIHPSICEKTGMHYLFILSSFNNHFILVRVTVNPVPIAGTPSMGQDTD